MPETFGFTRDEVKLLLVAVRHMRRTFAQAQQTKRDASLKEYTELYDALFEKLKDMTGPLPSVIEDALD